VKEWGYVVFLKLFFRQGFSQNFSTPTRAHTGARVLIYGFNHIVLTYCLSIN